MFESLQRSRSANSPPRGPLPTKRPGGTGTPATLVSFLYTIGFYVSPFHSLYHQCIIWSLINQMSRALLSLVRRRYRDLDRAASPPCSPRNPSLCVEVAPPNVEYEGGPLLEIGPRPRGPPYPETRCGRGPDPQLLRRFQPEGNATGSRAWSEEM